MFYSQGVTLPPRVCELRMVGTTAECIEGSNIQLAASPQLTISDHPHNVHAGQSYTGGEGAWKPMKTS